jgi:hypothetical protein
LRKVYRAPSDSIQLNSPVAFGSTATLGCAGFAIVDGLWRLESEEHLTAKSGCATKTAKRTTASRSDLESHRDADRALATGRVALTLGKPSQRRRSLFRFPASGPQGFWPVGLNI